MDTLQVRCLVLRPKYLPTAAAHPPDSSNGDDVWNEL
jgi:hypothetical protein